LCNARIMHGGRSCSCHSVIVLGAAVAVLLGQLCSNENT
jgi:hypothetical protein